MLKHVRILSFIMNGIIKFSGIFTRISQNYRLKENSGKTSSSPKKVTICLCNLILLSFLRRYDDNLCFVIIVCRKFSWVQERTFSHKMSENFRVNYNSRHMNKWASLSVVLTLIQTTHEEFFESPSGVGKSMEGLTKTEVLLEKHANYFSCFYKFTWKHQQNTSKDVFALNVFGKQKSLKFIPLCQLFLT